VSKFPNFRYHGNKDRFLPRDASAERGYEIACHLSVCETVTTTYRDHIRLNTLKII